MIKKYRLFNRGIFFTIELAFLRSFDWEKSHRDINRFAILDLFQYDWRNAIFEQLRDNSDIRRFPGHLDDLPRRFFSERHSILWVRYCDRYTEQPSVISLQNFSGSINSLENSFTCDYRGNFDSFTIILQNRISSEMFENSHTQHFRVFFRFERPVISFIAMFCRVRGILIYGPEEQPVFSSVLPRPLEFS